jgi:hypothetical protein
VYHAHFLESEDDARLQQAVHPAMREYAAAGLEAARRPPDPTAYKGYDQRDAGQRRFDFETYFPGRVLMGGPQQAIERIKRLKEVGITQIAMLVDFGSLPQTAIMHSEELRVDLDCQELHDFIEEMWEKYWPYADSDFLPKARNRDFQACYWEMYLGFSLLRQNMQIEPRRERKRLWGSSDKGPDFKIVAPYTLWLEAITPGADTTEDAVPEAELGVARQVPDDEVKLRLLHAIRDKAKQRLYFTEVTQFFSAAPALVERGSILEN